MRQEVTNVSWVGVVILDMPFCHPPLQSVHKKTNKTTIQRCTREGPPPNNFSSPQFLAAESEEAFQQSYSFLHWTSWCYLQTVEPALILCCLIKQKLIVHLKLFQHKVFSSDRCSSVKIETVTLCNVDGSNYFVLLKLSLT